MVPKPRAGCKRKVWNCPFDERLCGFHGPYGTAGDPVQPEALCGPHGGRQSIPLGEAKASLSVMNVRLTDCQSECFRYPVFGFRNKIKRRIRGRMGP
jgi:hypothetical protein